jgi:hypothetical protein
MGAALTALCAALALAGVAGAAAVKKPSLSATPVFKVHMKPSQECRASRASGRRRSATSRSTSSDRARVRSRQARSASTSTTPTSFTDADGRGNITRVVSGSAATLQAILDNPRGYYVNLHTTTPPHPGGAVRAQLRNPKKG